MDKMTIEKAKKVVELYGCILDQDEMEQEWIHHRAGVPTKNEAIECRGFIEGYEAGRSSRGAEVALLKSEVEELKNIIKDLGAEDVLKEKM